MFFVLDSCALIALIKNEPGGEVVDSILSDKDNSCAIHALNLCEVYYDIVRLTSEKRAKEIINKFVLGGIDIREDMDADFWQDAGNLKAAQARISLADCICVALANRLGVVILTSDHHEFESVSEKKLCKVRFIR